MTASFSKNVLHHGVSTEVSHGNQLPEDRSRANSQNKVYIKYTSHLKVM